MNTEEFEKARSEMPDNDLIKKADSLLSELCKTGGKGFRMTVPPRVDDTDMIFSELIKRYQKAIQVQAVVSPIFTEEEHRILNLLLASKIAEIQVNIVYDEPLDQRMGKVKLMNILNDIHKKVKIRS